MAKIGPLDTWLFNRMQTQLALYDVPQRYEALFNLLVLMKEQDENHLLQPLP